MVVIMGGMDVKRVQIKEYNSMLVVTHNDIFPCIPLRTFLPSIRGIQYTTAGNIVRITETLMQKKPTIANTFLNKCLTILNMPSKYKVRHYMSAFLRKHCNGNLTVEDVTKFIEKVDAMLVMEKLRGKL